MKDIVALYSELADLSKDEQQQRLSQLRTSNFKQINELENMLFVDDSPLSSTQLLTQELSNPNYTNAPSFIGQQVMGFTIVRLISDSGGMGLIFQGEQRITCPESGNVKSHKAAIKILRTDKLNFSQQKTMFFNEASSLMALEHAHVCSIYGVSEVLGYACIVMDFIDGESLDVWLTHCRRSKKKKLRLFKQLLEAMSYLHRLQVFHGDLKPQNIMVTEHEQLVLIDLGLARKLQPSNTVFCQTSIQAFSRDWSAPEQINGEGFSAQSDVYSLGIVLHYLLTGKVSIKTLNSKYPELNALIQKALSEQPKDRFNDAQTLMARFDAYIQGFPISEYSNGRLYQFYKLLRRKPFTSLASVLMIYSIFTSLWIVLH